MKQRHLVWLVISGNALALMVLAVLFARYQDKLAADRDAEVSWLTYKNIPFPTLDSSYSPGQPVRMVVKRHSSATERRLYPVAANLVSDSGGETIIVPVGSPAIVDPGDSEWISTVCVIPPNTPAGTWHLEGIAQVQGNYKTFAVEWSSQKFKVPLPSY